MSELNRLKRALGEENLNELSKDTMSSYMMKASDKNVKDAVDLVKKGRKMSNSEYADADYKIKKRDKNIRKVISKLNRNEDIDEACWKGYVQAGMKEKEGKVVPNCVPTDSVPKKVKIKEDAHGYYVPYYDKHGNKAMGKFFKKKEDAEKHLNDNPHKTDSYYPVNNKYERISESSDYSRRRQKEEDIISGKKPARKRIPKGNDYFQRRKRQDENI